jgi:hypothetical protein
MPVSRPRVLALFDKRFEGDDALLRLAALRFKQAGLGPEFYAETPPELSRLLAFMPSKDSPATVHLSREINLLERKGRDLVLEFVTGFKGRILGFIVHDQAEIEHHFDDYLDAVRELESNMKDDGDTPYVFIEYAAGLRIETYIKFLRSIRDLKRISGCIDTGHVGLRHAKDTYAGKHQGKDIFVLKPGSPELPELIGDVQDAVRSSLDALLYVVRELSVLKKPLHFHLHDGHPLSTDSPFGISDHLSFLTRIPIPFEYEGRELLRPMYGPSGLSKIIGESLKLLGADLVTFSLEIHPTEGRLPLGDAAHFFRHCKDKTNAERMNFWLSVLSANHLLLLDLAGNPFHIDSP